MANIAPPYRRPSADRAAAGAWMLRIGDVDFGELPDDIPSWDYNTDLRISRTLKIDRAGILSDAKLAPNTDIIVAVIWESSGSRQRRRVFRAPISSSGDVTIDCTLIGTEVGGTLTISTHICLDTTATVPVEPFTAHLGGSILWSDEVSVRLEDDAPQFPVTIVDFALTNLPEQSGWFVQIDSDLNNAAMGSLLLCVNQSNAAISSAFENAGNPRTDTRILSVVHADIARQMIEHALTDEEFDHDIDYPDESLGRMFQSLIQRLFPDQNISDIRTRRNTFPALFSAEVQDAVRILGDQQ